MAISHPQQVAKSSVISGSMSKASHVRYGVLALIFVVTVYNFADRSTMSIAGVDITKHFGMGPTQLGFIFSAFSWAYALGQFPGGWLLDRFGARRVYGTSIILWSFFTFAQGWVDTISMMGISAVFGFFFLRFMLGLVESPAFPANSRIVAAWFPVSERGFASSLFASAQYFAVVIFTPLMAWLTHALGWQHVFLWMGSGGMLLGIAWFFLYRDPTSSKRVNEAELELLREGGALIDIEEKRRQEYEFHFRDVICLFKSRILWGIYIGQYCITALTYFFITWFPIYLVQARGMSIMHAGLVAALPAICGCSGGILGGLLSDFLVRRGIHPSPARKAPFVIGMAIATTLVLANFADSDAVVVMLMGLAFFGKGLAAVGWGMIADTAPERMIGLSGGIFNGLGNLSGIATPIVVGYVVAITHSFDLALWFVAAHAIIAIFAILIISGRFERIELPDRSHTGAAH